MDRTPLEPLVVSPNGPPFSGVVTMEKRERQPAVALSHRGSQLEGHEGTGGPTDTLLQRYPSQRKPRVLPACSFFLFRLRTAGHQRPIYTLPLEARFSLVFPPPFRVETAKVVALASVSPFIFHASACPAPIARGRRAPCLSSSFSTFASFPFRAVVLSKQSFCLGPSCASSSSGSFPISENG